MTRTSIITLCFSMLLNCLDNKPEKEEQLLQNEELTHIQHVLLEFSQGVPDDTPPPVSGHNGQCPWEGLHDNDLEHYTE